MRDGPGADAGQHAKGVEEASRHVGNPELIANSEQGASAGGQRPCIARHLAFEDAVRQFRHRDRRAIAVFDPRGAGQMTGKTRDGGRAR